MLKQRNVIALSLLLGTSSLVNQTPVAQGLRLSSKKKDDEEGPKVEAKANHPPKEVSHYTQEQVKAWLKRSFWRDNALPTTPSYNEGDSEAYTHPQGVNFVQNDGKWTDGNGAGSEKVDYWWHLDHHQHYPGENYKFDDEAKKPTGELKSWNHNDSEPKWHPNGITASAQIPKGKQSLVQWWTHGNGQGSEKWDGIEEAARFVNSQDAFHAKVNLQGNFIPNVNNKDTEPTGHPNGFTAAAQLDTDTNTDSDEKWWTHGNGQGSEKWDGIVEAARFSNSPEEFHEKVKNQGYYIPNVNDSDAEPKSHPSGITASAQINQSSEQGSQAGSQSGSKQWTHGNGQGSEKFDFVDSAARFANTEEEFHAQLKNAAYIPNMNQGDEEPTWHSNGFTAAAQKPAPVSIGEKLENLHQAKSESKAKWWTFGNGQGSEKWDGFDEAARFSNSQEEFHEKSAYQGYFIPNVNVDDLEPTSHPNGFTAASQVNSKTGTSAESQAGSRWWTHGNGQGSEKWDGIEEAARFSNSQDEFDQKMGVQGNFIPNVNNADSEPVAHPMGFSFVQEPRSETDHERFWMNIAAMNSKDEFDFNKQAAKIKLPASNQDDLPPSKN